MSTAPTPPAEQPKPKRIKKRIYIPLILLVLLIAIGIGFYVRGNWPDTVERNPSGPDAGTVTQLLQKPDGNVVVRCAVIVDASPKETWAIVSDYASHHQFVPYITHLEEIRQDDGRLLIDGVAHSSVWGDWPFKTLVTQKVSPEAGEYDATWSHEDEGVYKVNRGGWSLRPVDKTQKQTLLAFNLQIELKEHPNWIVRNIVMDRVHKILKAMRDQTLKRKDGHEPMKANPHK